MILLRLISKDNNAPGIKSARKDKIFMLLNKKEPSCDYIRELMFDYIDGELDASNAALVEAHVASCDKCAKELEERKELLSLVKGASAKVPSELYGRVMAEVENTPQNAKILRPKFRIKPWMSTAVAACAVIMILVAGRGYLFGGAEMLDAAPDMVRSGDAAEDIVVEDNVVDADVVNPSGELNYSGAGAVDTNMVIESTGAFSGYSPSYSAMPSNPNVLEDSTDLITAQLLDGVFEMYKTDDTAILVCNYSDVADVLPEGEGELSDIYFGVGASVVRYVISNDATTVFTGYVKLLEALGADFRAAVLESAEFSSCEIFLITDTKE